MRKKHHRIAAFLGTLLLLVLAVAGSLKNGPTVRALADGQLIPLRDQWSAAPESPTGFCDYMYTIPALEGDAHTVSLEVFWSSAALFLDGEELVSYQKPPAMGGTVRLWADLPEDCGGSTLTLRLERDSRSSQRVLSGNSYLGSTNAVFAKFIFDNLYVLVFGCFSALLGCIVLAGGYFFSFRQRPGQLSSSLFLGLFMFLSGAWVLCDSQFLLLFSGNAVRTVFVSFVTFMAMPISLLLYIRNLLSYRSWVLDILCHLQALNLLVMMVCFLLDRKEPYGTLVVCHILLVCSIVAVVVLCMEDVRKHNNQEIRGIIGGFMLLGACGLAALPLFYLVPDANYACLYSIGMTLFVLCLAWGNMKKLYSQMEKSIQAEAYQRLAYSDVLTGLGNRAALAAWQARRTPEHATLVMFDLNDLKTINDGHGHFAGDAAIIAAAESIREAFQGLGRCYRIGGDEFLAILEDAPEQAITAAKQRVEQHLAQKSRDLPYGITLAMGTARSTGPDETWDSLFSRADRYMYQEKERLKKAHTVSTK